VPRKFKAIRRFCYLATLFILVAVGTVHAAPLLTEGFGDIAQFTGSG
jgi:hypothetical protein